MLTNDHGKNETENDVVEEMTQVETDQIVLNESTCKLVTKKKINQMVENNHPKYLE